MTKVRWKCPECNVGKLGPKAFPKGDARAVCLPCTQKRVEQAKGPVAYVILFCPTLDRKAKADALKKAEKKALAKIYNDARMEAERLAFITKDGLDIHKEFHKVWKAVHMSETDTVRRFENKPDLALTLTHYWYANRAKALIKISPNGGPDLVRCNLIAAVAWWAAAGKGPLWRKAFCDIANDAYGTKLNWTLRPKVLLKKGRATADLLREEFLAQRKIQGTTGANDFLALLRSTIHQPGYHTDFIRARARLMVLLAPKEAQDLARDYVAGHYP
jgi:hypothetical protein